MALWQGNSWEEFVAASLDMTTESPRVAVRKGKGNSRNTEGVGYNENTGL